MSWIAENRRIALRPLELTDQQDLHDILGDEHTMRFYPRPYKADEVLQWIERSRQSYMENGFGLWAVIQKSSNQFLGQCGILTQNIDSEIVPEIGYQINRIFWGQGFAGDAARLSMQIGFSDLNLNEIYIHTYVKNKPSIRVAEKLQFQFLKSYPKYLKAIDSYWDHVVYRMSRESYQTMSDPEDLS